MSSLSEDEIIEIANSSKENIVPQAKSNSLKNNLKSKTSLPLPSRTVSKRYLSKLKKEWLSDPQYSSFLRECKNDATKALCIPCNIQFSIQNSGMTDVNNHMKTKKHQKCLKSIESNKSEAIHSIFHSTTSELNRVSATEGVLVFHS
ncbi:unnamed protein product, partial [Rotaria sp. Silwood1]